MKGQSRRALLTVVCVLGVLSLLLPASRTARAQQTGPNLLVNGDFEKDPGVAWPYEMGIPEVQVAPGWHAYWLDSPPAGTIIAEHCRENAADTGCYWARPEFRGLIASDFAYRVHGGNLSQKYFTFGRQHEAGLYQQVSGITPGSLLRFQIYMETWSCLAGDQWNVCPTGEKSNKPAYMHTMVGIDPTGGTNPWAGTVVWAPEQDAFDAWTLFSVEATAQNSTVTVFTHSRVEWYDHWARLHNDVYVDDGSLVVVGTGAVQPTVAPATSVPEPTTPVASSTTPEAPPTPNATPTPRPDGAVVHVVESGDTLFGIALEYDVDVDELRRLNAGTLGENDLLAIGQELVISGAAINISLPTPTPAPTQAQPITATVAPTVTAVAAATQVVSQTSKGAICVVAYNDRDGDTVRKADSEELLPNVAFSLVGANGPAGSYTTDGISEPYCFEDLEPGDYVVRQTSPTGYKTIGSTELGVLLSADQTYSLEIGYVSDAAAAETPSAEASVEEDEEAADKPASSLLSTIIRVSGIAAALLAVAVAVLFFVSRRKATP
ncbi:MAG: LysM peptidoglycan-binding domain-containing protein [Anaerolineae bacterium]|nr:LysM peptidoglycan-binding domain-containing protein [Anaerolineae bacterium]